MADKDGEAAGDACQEEGLQRRIACAVSDERVLRAFALVPRRLFVGADDCGFAGEDRPLPIGCGQTISQPSLVAGITEEMIRGRKPLKVLEIGAGSGYQAAILSRIVERVCAVERIAGLTELARTNLERAGCQGVELRHGDGAHGWPEEAPFDGIIVSAACSSVPPALQQQLAVGARLVIPLIEDGGAELLVVIERCSADSFSRRRLFPVSFVPLLPGVAD